VLLLVSGLLTITSVAAQQAMSIIVIASQCEFETTQAEKGVMMAASVTGKSLCEWAGIHGDHNGNSCCVHRYLPIDLHMGIHQR